MLFSKLENCAGIFIDRCIVLWTNQVLPLLNTSRRKDRTVSLFFLPKPLHSPPPPPPLGSYIALPSSRSLLKTKMAKVCARSRRSNGKIGDCEQSILLLVPFAVFLLCCLTGSRGYCNVSFYFFGHFGCHVKLHHSKAHGTFKLRKHGGRTFYKLKPTISSVVDLPESTGSVALRLSRKTLRS